LSSRVACRALMIRMVCSVGTEGGSVWETTRSRPLDDMPNVTKRLSSNEWSGSLTCSLCQYTRRRSGDRVAAALGRIAAGQTNEVPVFPAGIFASVSARRRDCRRDAHDGGNPRRPEHDGEPPFSGL